MANVKRKTLFGVLRSIVFWSVTLTLFVSSILFAAMFLYTMRKEREDNIMLIARTAAYATEAAVMFGDRDAARDYLNTILKGEEICQIAIYLGEGNSALPFVQADKACGRSFFSGEPARTEIRHDRQVLGQIEIRGDDSIFVKRILFRVLAVLFFCQGMTIVVARTSARWMEKRFSSELAALSGMAHAARLEGDFTRRLPAFEIAEFNGLGQDFNALFGELQMRNAELALRQSHLESANRILSNMALCDALTGLSNRANFSEQVEIAIKEARATGTRIGVLYIDNDHFKDINDSYGHAAGDALLVNVGKRLSGAVRESDLVARLGGDEFAILLAPLGSEDDLRYVANKVLAAMARKLRLSERGGIDIELGVSIGMAIFPDHGNDALSLLRVADHAMYRAKRLGRGRACLYDPSIDEVLEDD